MARARALVATALAERGRPQMWANEQEAAELSGMSAERFRQKVREFEKRGFPPVNPDNGKRSIPAILAFWKLAANDRAEAGKTVSEFETFS